MWIILWCCVNLSSHFRCTVVIVRLLAKICHQGWPAINIMSMCSCASPVLLFMAQYAIVDLWYRNGRNYWMRWQIACVRWPRPDGGHWLAGLVQPWSETNGVYGISEVQCLLYKLTHGSSFRYSPDWRCHQEGERGYQIRHGRCHRWRPQMQTLVVHVLIYCCPDTQQKLDVKRLTYKHLQK